MEREFWRIAMEDLRREVDSGHVDPVRLHNLITRAEDAVLSRYLELCKDEDHDERRELGDATKEILKLQTKKLG
jgi:hypothetical protein